MRKARIVRKKEIVIRDGKALPKPKKVIPKPKPKKVIPKPKEKYGKISFETRFIQKKLYKPLDELEKNMKEMSIDEVNNELSSIDSNLNNFTEHLSRRNKSLLDEPYHEQIVEYFTKKRKVEEKNETTRRIIKYKILKRKSPKSKIKPITFNN